MKQWKRLIAFIMAMTILFSNFPVSAAAVQAEDGTCQHHTHPSDSCAYQAAVPEQKCTHVHNQGCYVVNCLHTEEHAGCSFDPGQEGSDCSCPVNEETGQKEHVPETCTYQEGIPPTPCNHVCTVDSGCVTDELKCGHTDDGLCHVTPAVAFVACDYTCSECLAEQEPGDAKDVCICEYKCESAADAGSCEVCSADHTQCAQEQTKPVCSCEYKCESAADAGSCEVCSADHTQCAQEQTKPVCSCAYKCESAADAGSCEVCSADHTQCAQELTKPVCSCEYKCGSAEDAASCPVCSVDGEWVNCEKEPKPLECTCQYQCTADHEDETCEYCAQADDCKQTLVWEQKYGKVKLAMKWDDLSNEFGYRDAMMKLFSLMQGDQEIDHLSYTFGSDGDTWNITIDNIPLYKEYSDEMITYTLKQSTTDEKVAAYQVVGTGSAELTGFNAETGEFQPVEMVYKLVLGDVTGSVTWDSEEHPSAAYFFETYFGAKLGEKDLTDRLAYTVSGNTYSFTIQDVPQKNADGSEAEYTLSAADVAGFAVDENTKTATTAQGAAFTYTRQVDYTENRGTQVKVNWLDGSGTDVNMHPGELELNLSYTLNGEKHTITDFTWDEAKQAYVHEWTEDEKRELYGLVEGAPGYEAIEPLTISDEGNNSLMRTLKTSRLPMLENTEGEELISWGAPVVKSIDFEPKELSDGVHVDSYEMEWFDGGYRMTPMVKVSFELNLRSGNDSTAEVLDLLEKLALDGVNGDKIFALEGNNGFATQYISAADLLATTPKELVVNGKKTLLYSYETSLKAYDSTDKQEMEYNIDCNIQDNVLIPDAGAASIDGYHGFDLEYNNVEVPGKGGLTDTAYNGGRIILTKNGHRDYNATKIWLDDGDVSQRPDATYTLWRYAVGDYSNASQVELNDQYTFNLAKDAFEIDIEHLNLPRYDADGYEFIYLIREKQNESDYEKVFGVVDVETEEVTDTLPDGYKWEERQPSDTSVYHNGTISNRRTGTLPHTVTKKWNAAYYQDQLQDVMVELTIYERHVDDQVDEELKKWSEYDKIILSGFDALHTTVTKVLNLPKYGHMGHEIEYKVVETGIRQISAEPLTEEGEDDQPGSDVTVTDDLESSREFMLPMNYATLEEESIVDATDYFVSTSKTTINKDKNGNTVSQETMIVNELKGETAYFIRKTWDTSMDTDNVTFTLSQTGTEGTKIYGQETIESPAAYQTNSHDSGWIRGEWKDGKWQLPRYDKDGNVYTYMVLEQDNNSFESTYTYGHDVDGDGEPELNSAMIHNAPIGLSRYINVRKVWYDDSANTDRGPAKFRIEATGVTPNAVIYGTNGLLGSEIIVNEQSNWWDKVNVTLFLHEGKLYDAEGFQEAANRAPAATDLYTGGFCVTEVSIGTSMVGNAPETAAGFDTVQNGKTLFAVMYNHPNATGAVQHDDALYYNATGAVSPIQVSAAVLNAIAQDEPQGNNQQNYNANEFYTVTNLRIGSYGVTVNKNWEDDLTGHNPDEVDLVRPEATFTLSCTEYPESLNQAEGENNDYAVVSKVLHPEGKQPIQNNEAAGEDAVQKLKGEQDQEIVFFYNLPLYDGYGKVIHYQVEETMPKGVKYQSVNTGVKFDYGTMNQGKLEATQGFTNKPQHTYGVSFHLLWLDEFRQQNNQRPDVYLKLYAMSGDQTEPVALPFSEYHWTHNAAADTSADAWTYTFENLDEFDENGKKITYYARIFTVADEKSQDYIDLQYGAGQDTTLSEWSGDSKLTDVDQTVNTYPVSLNQEKNNGVVLVAEDGSYVMKQDNTFVYQIKDELKITGKKIWDAVPEGFPAEDLPVLNFILRNRNADGEIRAIVWNCVNENYTYTFDIYKVGMCDKYGQPVTDQAALDYWNKLADQGLVTDLPYGSLLPRYDEEGNLDTYHIDEEIYAKEVVGVETEISYEEHWGDIEDVYQLRNTFNKRDSNQSEISISKKWLKKNAAIDPDTFDFPEKVTFNLYRFYYDIYDEAYSPLTAPLEMPENQANADGDPIATVEITKAELLASEGDVVKSFGDQWVYAPNGTPFIYYIEEVALDGYDPMALKLPSSVTQVTPAEGSSNWPEAIGKSWHTDAFNLLEQREAEFTMPAENDYIAEQVELTGAKNWTDHQNSQNTRPASLTLELYRRAAGVPEHKIATVTLNSDGTATVAMADGKENVSGAITATVNTTQDKSKWSYTISNLDKFYSTTAAWSYRVKEIAPAEYTGSTTQTSWKSAGAVETITGMDLTNVLQTNVSATKNWDLLNAGVEVPTIKVALQVSNDNGATWKFAKDYFTGTKAWNNMSSFEKELTTGNTSVSYSNLPKGENPVDNGYQEFKYRVVETMIGGKAVAFDANGNYAANNGTEYIITNGAPSFKDNTHSNTITNKPDDQVTEFTVTKVWVDDNGNAFYTRGGSAVNGNRNRWSVTFDLWRYETDANGNKIANSDEQVRNRAGTGYITLTVNQSSKDSKASVTDLAAKTADGKTYVYYAKEQGITDNGNYFGSYDDAADHSGSSAAGFETNYTNDLITTQLSVTKVWYSHDGKPATFQPNELTVTLWQSSKNVTERNITDWYQFKDPNWGSNSWTKNSDGTWTVTFTDLPMYDSQGEAYTYKVKENRLDGYLKPVEGATTTDNTGNQSQTVTNIPTVFYMDKISSVNASTKLDGVKLIFGNATTKDASTTVLTWERDADGAERYAITRNGANWSSGSSETGNVTIQGLPVGTYYLVEEPTIPEGYTNSAVGTSFTLTETGLITAGDDDFGSVWVQNIQDSTYYKYRLNVEDKPTELTLTKKGKNGANLTAGYLFSVKPASGSKFTNGTVKYIAGSGVTIPSDGLALAKADLIVGHTYILEEVQAPDYYLRSFGSVTFKLKDNGTIDTFTDHNTNGATASVISTNNSVAVTFRDPDFNVALMKTSSKDGSALKDAQFELQKWNGTDWVKSYNGTLITDQNGQIKLNSVTHQLLLGENNRYRLLETVATPGYELILDENDESASYVEFYAKQNASTGALEVYQGNSLVSVDSKLKMHKLSMTNTPIEMEFVKKDMGDALNEEVVKAGVEFTLEAVGNSDIPKQVDTTDVHGKIYFGPASYTVNNDHTFMVIGGQAYKLTETVPAGYATTQTVREFTVTKDGKFSFQGNPETFTIENTRIPGKVQLVKQDSKGNVMDGVTFIMKDNKGNARIVETGKAYSASYDDADNLHLTPVAVPNNTKTGKLSIEGLAWGAYSLEEKVPTGYKTPGFKQDFIVTGANAEAGVVLNQNNNTVINTPVEVNVWKVDAKNLQAPISGAVYKLFDQNGKEITANTAYGDGNIQLYNKGALVTMPTWSWNQNEGKGTAFRLEPGTYTLKETTVPAGYEQADDFTFTVNADGTVTSTAPKNDEALLAVDTQIEFRLEKKDSVSGNALDGVTFKVSSLGVALGTKATHGGGILTFGYANANPKPDFAVEIGKTYTVEEVETVDGYERMTGSFSFTVNTDGTIHKASEWAECVTLNSEGLVITANNTPIEIILVKKAAGDGIVEEKLLGGVEFTLTNLSDGKTQTDTTVASGDDIGKLYFGPVSDSNSDHTFAVVGDTTYTLSETAPDGYADIAEITFKVTTDGKLQMQESDGVSLSNGNEMLTIMNQRLPGGVKLTKNDSLGYTMNGVEFTLLRGNQKIDVLETGFAYQAETADKTVTVDKSGETIGTLEITNLPWGDYTLIETRPVGYQKDRTYTYPFTIDENDAKLQDGKMVVLEELTVVNTPVQVNVMKVDTEDTAPYSALTGAEYELYKRDGNTDTKIEGSYNPEDYVLFNQTQEAVEIDLWNWDAETGTGTAFRLEEGTYVLKEITPPAGYEVAEEITFEINADGQVASVSTATHNDTILAKDTPVSFELVKKDSSTGGLMEGVQFEIKGGGATYVKKTDANGLITFGKDVPVVVGTTYTVREMNTLDGFELLEDTFAFTLQNDGTIRKEGTWPAWVTLDNAGLQITANNTPIEIDLIKKDGGDGIDGADILPGVEFTLTGGKTGEQKTTTDGAGKIYLRNKAGDHTFVVTSGVEYTLTESAPDGFADLDPITFAITTDGKLQMTASEPVSVSQDQETLTIVNKRNLGSVKLTKLDADGNQMNGVEFVLSVGQSEVATLTTGWSYTAKATAGKLTLTPGDETKGTIEIADLPWGSYTLTEKQPAGYKTTSASFDFQIAKDSETGKVLRYETTVTNTPVQLTVTKVDKDNTNTVLTGADYNLFRKNADGTETEITAYTGSIKLYDAEGEEVTIPMWSWDADTGTGTAFRLAPGSYVLRETRAPEGYKLAADVSFTIDGNGTISDLAGEAQSSGQQIKVKDEKIHFELQKKDGGDQFAEKSDLKTPVKFTLTDSKNVSHTATTDSKGMLYFGAENGDHSFKVIGGQEYTLTEVADENNPLYSATRGYYTIGSVKLKVAEDGTVSVTRNVDKDHKGTVTVADNKLLIEVADERILGTVTLKKIDQISEDALNNVVFRLYRKVTGKTWFDNFLNFITGKQYEVVKDFKWDDSRNPADETVNEEMELDLDQADGVLTITGLPWGEYKLVEIKAEGYIITPAEDGRTYPFTISPEEGTSHAYDLKEITNIPNKLTVTKVAFEDNTKILPGAVYELYDPNGEKITDDRWSWDSEKGTGTATRLAVGEYTLKETFAPKGYVLGADIRFQIDKYGTVTMNGKAVEDNAILAMDKQTKFTFTKKELYQESCSDYAHDSRILPGVTFTAYEDAALTKVLGTAVSDESGTVTFIGLPLKDYMGVGTNTPVYIKETATVAGHVLDTTVYQVYVDSVLDANGEVISRSTLKRNGTDLANNTVINDVFRGDFSFTKVNELDNRIVISGAVYGLYKTVTLTGDLFSTEQEILVAKATSNDYGIVTFQGLLMDVEYTVKELSVPDGCYVSKNPITFKYTWEDGSAKLTILDDGEDTVTEKNGDLLWQEPQTIVSILKVKKSGHALSGAKLQIRDMDGNVIPVLNWDGKLVNSWISGKDPMVVTGQLTAGESYWLYELEAPSGYIKARRQKFTVPSDPAEPGEERVLKVTMVNHLIPTNPKTGDELPVYQLMAAAVLSGLALLLLLVVAVIRKFRKKK